MRAIDAYTAISLIQEDKIEGKTLDIMKMLGDGLQAETLNQACDRHIKIINSLPTIDVKPIRHGKWIKMSDADGIYYACSECGNDLPRVIDSFNPQFDLFPKLKCIDKTTYCPNCGAKMDKGQKNDTKRY